MAMASACYCAPAAVASIPQEKAVAPHCEHHSASGEAKETGCAPRFHAEDIENFVLRVKPVTQKQNEGSFPAAEVFYLFHIAVEGSALVAETDIRPSLDASPPIYILIRSLLL